jgi:hypothetical protein
MGAAFQTGGPRLKSLEVWTEVSHDGTEDSLECAVNPTVVGQQQVNEDRAKGMP